MEGGACRSSASVRAVTYGLRGGGGGEESSGWRWKWRVGGGGEGRGEYEEEWRSLGVLEGWGWFGDFVCRRLAAQVSEKERERDRGKQKSRPFSFPVAVLLCPSNFDVILIFFLNDESYIKLSKFNSHRTITLRTLTVFRITNSHMF